MTVPNIKTTLRILLAPVFVIYLINDHLIAGLIILIISGISDGVDGMVARLFNQKSRLGTYLDPLADKITLVSAFIALTTQDYLPFWLTVTVISRDILILVGVSILFLINLTFIVKPTLSSKVTTCFQFITIIAVLSRELILLPPEFYHALFYVTAFFTIVSFLQYMYQWFKLVGEDHPDNGKAVQG